MELDFFGYDSVCKRGAQEFTDNLPAHTNL